MMKTTLTSEQELEKWESLVTEYERSNGIPDIKSPGTSDELQKYLAMDMATLQSLTPENLEEIAVRLSQYSFYIQRIQNKEIARENWANTTIKLVVANEINNYKGYGYEEKLQQAIKNNSRAAILKKIAIYSNQRSSRLQYISSSINNLSTSLKSLAKTRLKLQSYED